MNVQEGRDVTEVEQTDMTEVDRLLVKQLGRDHSHRNHVPRRPHGFPLIDRGDGERARGRNADGRFEERERERRSLEKPQRVTRGGVHPALDWTKVCNREQAKGILLAELVQS